MARRESPPDLDRQARTLLDAVGDRAADQLAVIAALDALAESLPADGVLRALVQRERAVRAGALRARHLVLVQHAIAQRERTGPHAHEAVVRALEEAVTAIAGMEGETGQVRTLRLQLDDARRGLDGAPRPFFARFLEGQHR
jgi:hypothetical protein